MRPSGFSKLLFLLFTSAWLGAQEAAPKKHTVLFMTFDRFEFHTEVKLSYINKVNSLEGDQYYELLSRAFIDAFVLGDFPNVEYREMSSEDCHRILPLLSFKVYHGMGHYAANLDDLHQNMLQKLLSDYDCQYLMIVDWYRIFESLESTKSKNVKQFNTYAEHMMDFDLFNSEKKRTDYGADLRFGVKPTPDNLKYSGLRISDLRLEFHKLAVEISRGLKFE